MKAELSILFREISGKLNDEYYCRMVNGRPVVCHMPKKRGVMAEPNKRLARAARMTRELLKDEEFRREQEELMRVWNAQFPKNWEAPYSARKRRSVPHPYTSLYTFVMAGVMKMMNK